MHWRMLQQPEPEDFVIASGVQYSVRDFVNSAARELGFDIRWEGSGVEEKGYDAAGRCIVQVDSRYFVRPRWKHCSVISERRSACSGGNRRSVSGISWLRRYVKT